MKKLFAFDVDGTLADVYSNIQPGVTSLFKDKRIENCIVAFITGNTITTIKKMRQNLKKLSNNKLNIQSYCASLGGSIIYNEKDEIVFKKSFCKRRLISFFDKSIALEPDCFFMLMLENKQIFCHIPNKQTEDYIRSYFGRMNMDHNEIYFCNEDYHTLLRKLPEIYSVNIFNAKDAYALQTKLLPEIIKKGYATYIEHRMNMLQISANSKLKALKFIMRKLKENNIYGDGAKNAVFFGDGGNDITSMQYCNLSVARGLNLTDDVVAVGDIYADDLTPYLNKIFD